MLIAPCWWGRGCSLLLADGGGGAHCSPGELSCKSDRGAHPKF